MIKINYLGSCKKALGDQRKPDTDMMDQALDAWSHTTIIKHNIYCHLLLCDHFINPLQQALKLSLEISDHTQTFPPILITLLAVAIPLALIYYIYCRSELLNFTHTYRLHFVAFLCTYRTYMISKKKNKVIRYPVYVTVSYMFILLFCLCHIYMHSKSGHPSRWSVAIFGSALSG